MQFSFFRYWLTSQSLTKNFNQYTGQQYIDLKREANRNRFTGEYLRDENIFTPFELEAIDNKEFVDWEDLVLSDATIQSHALSVTAGSEKTKVFSSINYFTQDGIIPNSGFNRGHLVASANQIEENIQNSETFLLSNMAPQRPMFNRGIWKRLETAVRALDSLKKVFETYVISGPIFFFDEEIESRQKKIAERYNFDLQDHSLYLYGICENCQ